MGRLTLGPFYLDGTWKPILQIGKIEGVASPMSVSVETGEPNTTKHHDKGTSVEFSSPLVLHLFVISVYTEII